MVDVLDREDDARLSVAKRMSNSFAELLPVPGGDGLDVTRFLLEAAHALRVREAELARLQGISQATQSSWKKRGAIPDQGLPWFQEQFVPLVLQVEKPAVSRGFYDRGIHVAFAIFDETDWNPFGETFPDRPTQIQACYEHLSALGNLGGFVIHRLIAHHRDDMDFQKDLWDRVVPKTIELARLGRALI